MFNSLGRQVRGVCHWVCFFFCSISLSLFPLVHQRRVTLLKVDQTRNKKKPWFQQSYHKRVTQISRRRGGEFFTRPECQSHWCLPLSSSPSSGRLQSNVASACVCDCLQPSLSPRPWLGSMLSIFLDNYPNGISLFSRLPLAPRCLSPPNDASDLTRSLSFSSFSLLFPHDQSLSSSPNDHLIVKKAELSKRGVAYFANANIIEKKVSSKTRRQTTRKR